MIKRRAFANYVIGNHDNACQAAHDLALEFASIGLQYERKGQKEANLCLRVTKQSTHLSLHTPRSKNKTNFTSSRYLNGRWKIDQEV